MKRKRRDRSSSASSIERLTRKLEKIKKKLKRRDRGHRPHGDRGTSHRVSRRSRRSRRSSTSYSSSNSRNSSRSSGDHREPEVHSHSPRGSRMSRTRADSNEIEPTRSSCPGKKSIESRFFPGHSGGNQDQREQVLPPEGDPQGGQSSADLCLVGDLNSDMSEQAPQGGHSSAGFPGEDPSDCNKPEEPGLDEIFGINPDKADSKPEFALHSELEPRWRHTLAHGLTRADKALILRKYPYPTNLKTLRPPLLNPELKRDVEKIAAAKDSSHVEIQAQLGGSLSAIGVALNLLLESQQPIDRKPEILTALGDASRLVAHVFYRESLVRREFHIDKSAKPLREQLMTSEVGEYLFPNLEEHVEADKKQAQVLRELKPPAPAKSGSTRPNAFNAKKRGGAAYRGSRNKSPQKDNSSTSGNYRRPVHPQRGARSGRASSQEKTKPSSNQPARRRKY